MIGEWKIVTVPDDSLKGALAKLESEDYTIHTLAPAASWLGTTIYARREALAAADAAQGEK